MDTLRDTIERCKSILPLPDLWKKLDLKGEPKRSCNSPFRQDNNPSFSVWQSGKQWFWRDQAWGKGGDEIDLLMQAQGIEKKEAIRVYHEMCGVELPEKFQRKPTGKSLGKLVKIYDYVNKDGQLVHQTLRFEPKTFRQRRPGREGMRQGGRMAKRERGSDRWWLWTLDGIEPVLYRLPQLLAAPLDVPVFLCEGEKDADHLAEAQGAVTTTAPMGAGKWRKSYTETLSGRDVVIVGHRDLRKCKLDSSKISTSPCPPNARTFLCDHCGQQHTLPGADHVMRVAEELKMGGAKRVRVVDWTEAWPDAAQDEARKLDVAEFIEGVTKNGVS